MTIQRVFKAKGEDTTILGKPQTWAYSSRLFRKSYTIEFHPASSCTYTCLHCQGLPHRDSWGTPPPKMSPDLVHQFFKAYDERKDKSLGMWRIIISGMNSEPLLNRRVTRLILQEAKDRSIATGLSTSGVLLTLSDSFLLASQNTDNDWVNLSVDSPIGSNRRFVSLYQRAHYCQEADCSRAKRNLEGLAKLKIDLGSRLQINVNWIISDLGFDPEYIGEDVLETIRYLNRLPGISLLRFQFPFYLHPQVPKLSDENSRELAKTLRKLMTGKIHIDGLRKNFTVKLRNNWYRRRPFITQCTAARDYGVVFGPDGRAYFCPYTASPDFEKVGGHLPQVNADNLWDVIEEIKPLDVEGITRCQMVCNWKNCFLDLGIVR